MAARGDRRGPFDPPQDERARAMQDFSAETPDVSAAPAPARDADADWWRDSPREAAPQWSLLELFLLTTGASLTAAVARFVSPIGLSAVLGVLFVFGWLRLHLDDWEPRWAVITWRTILVAYLVSTLITFFG